MKGYPIKYYTNNECLFVQCQLAIVRIFSFDERWNVPFNSAVASLNGTFHLLRDENILTIRH
jgi:hypothetical protein